MVILPTHKRYRGSLPNAIFFYTLQKSVEPSFSRRAYWGDKERGRGAMILRGIVFCFSVIRLLARRQVVSLSLLALSFATPSAAQNLPSLNGAVRNMGQAALTGAFAGLSASRISQLGRGQLLGSGLSAAGIGRGLANPLGGMFNGLNGRGLGVLAGASGIASGIGMGGLGSLGGFGQGGLGGLGGLGGMGGFGGSQLPGGRFVKPSVGNQGTSALRSAHGILMLLPKAAESDDSSKPQTVGQVLPNLTRNIGASLGSVAGGAGGLLGGGGAGGLLGGAGGGILAGVGRGMLGGLFAGLNPSSIMQLGVIGGLAGGLGRGMGGAGLGALFSGLNAGGIGQLGRAAGLFSVLGGGGLGAAGGLFSGLSPGRIVMFGALAGLVSQLNGGGAKANAGNLNVPSQSPGNPSSAAGVARENPQPQLHIEQF